MIELVALETVAADAVEHLLDRAFGTDRHTRTAYRLRAGVQALPGISLAAFYARTLVGSIQCWPVEFRGDEGMQVPLVMVGPVAVAPESQRHGVGRRLMQASLARCADSPLMLIGDPEYYARFFGFSAEHTGGWRLTGPVERHRLLARGTGIPDGAGTIGPRVLTTV